MFVLITFSNIMFIEWLEKCRGSHTEDWELMKISQATPHRNKRRNRSLSLFVGGSFNKLFVVLIKLRLYDFNWQRDSRKEFIGPASWSSGQGMGHRTLNSQHSPERIPGPQQPCQWGQLEILDWVRIRTSLCHCLRLNRKFVSSCSCFVTLIISIYPKSSRSQVTLKSPLIFINSNNK